MVHEPLHIRKRGDSLAVWAVLIIILWGIWTLRNSEDRGVHRPPRIGDIIHSTPVGGTLKDGIFHPQRVDEDLGSIRWRI